MSYILEKNPEDCKPCPPDVDVSASRDRCVSHTRYLRSNPFPWSPDVWERCENRSGHGPDNKYCRKHAWELHGCNPTPWWKLLFRRSSNV